jgi:hypothetical protein
MEDSMSDFEKKAMQALLGNDPEIAPVIGPLSWLKSGIYALHDLEQAIKDREEDPSAWFEMIQEITTLHDRGLEAMAAVKQPKLSIDDFPGCIEGRVASTFADRNGLAVVVENDGDEKVINVWDFDFNKILFKLPMSYASDEQIDQCLRLYVGGYKDGERMGQYHKAAEIKRALEIA